MEVQQEKRQSKGLIIGVIIALVVAIGGVSAYFIMKTTPKADYLLAESNTLNEGVELFKDRYKDEMKWAETQLDKPVASEIKISADWDDPTVDYSLQEVQSIVNNSELALGTVYDAKQKELEFALSGSLGNIEVDPFKFHLNMNQLFLTLPFAKETLFMNGKDFGKLAKELDPYYDGPEELDFTMLFDQEQIAVKQFQNYLEKEYGTYIYEQLPEKSFTSEKEEITIFDEKIKANKITMNLSEEETKTLLHDVLTKMEKDEKLKELMREVFIEQETGGLYKSTDDETDAADEMIAEFEDGIQAMKNDVKEDLHLPNGIQSVIWVDKKLIVKRDFKAEFGEENEQPVGIHVTGEQLFEKDQQQWNYDIKIFEEENSFEEIVTITGDLNWDGKKAKDEIAIDYEDIKVFYNGEESLKGKERTFTRTVGVDDQFEEYKLVWDGKATHEKDAAKSTNELTIDGDVPFVGDFSVIVDTNSKIVKKVDMPAEEDAVNVGGMSAQELEDYLYNELMPQFEQWAQKFMQEFENY